LEISTMPQDKTPQRERCSTLTAATILGCHPQQIQRLKLDPDFPKSMSVFRKDEFWVDEIERYRELRGKRKAEALEKRRRAHLKQQKRQRVAV
jgi:hypothetical protein